MEDNIKKMDSIKPLQGTPKDVFLHLLAVATLYVSVVAFITLWWQYVNVLFPDFLRDNGYNYSLAANFFDPIRLAMAALIIVFPIHILISWLIGREFRIVPEKREVRVRKWLWYITLFISAVTIIIDLIILVNNFLKGDLSSQFFLKIVIVLITAAAVFGYYLWDLNRRNEESNKPKLIAWITAVAMFASIVYGFFLIGLPSSQRARRFDEQRLNHLSIIQNEVINYWRQKDKLPESLDGLKNEIAGFVAPTDPETNQHYEYEITGELSFKLCANFKTSSVTTSIPIIRPYQQNWDHDSGHMCFARTIDPELYKQDGNIPGRRSEFIKP